MDDDDAVAQAPMDVVESSRKRSAGEAGHEQDDAARGDEQPDEGSAVDASMHEAMEVAGALGFGMGHGACSF